MSTFRRLLVLVSVVAFAACGGATNPAPTTPPATQVASPSTQPSVSPATPTTSAVPPAASPAASPLAALTLLWEKAGPAKVKTETYWPAINPITGNIWVADTFGSQFWIFSPDGKFLEAWGTPGSGNGQFKLSTDDPNPDGGGALAFAPDGSFYVTDVGNYRVEKFDRNRHFLLSWGGFGTGDGQFASPRGIAIDGKTVFVADANRGDMQVFDTDGTFLRSFPFPFVLFALTPNGDLACADNQGILEVDPMGHQLARIDVDFASLGGFSSQVAVDRAGHFFVGIQVDAGPVAMVELDAKGTILHEWSTGGETMVLSADQAAVYIAYTGPTNSGWPFIRKYAIPKG